MLESRRHTKNEKLYLRKGTGNEWSQIPQKSPCGVQTTRPEGWGCTTGGHNDASHGAKHSMTPLWFILFQQILLLSPFPIRIFLHGHFISVVYNYLFILQGIQVKSFTPRLRKDAGLGLPNNIKTVNIWGTLGTILCAFCT